MEKSNEKALKIIEHQYSSFINLSDQWGFFRGLAEYTKTVQELTQTRPLIEALEAQREMARRTYELMNTDAMSEFKKSAERMTSIVESITKQYEPFIKQNQEIAEKYQPIVKAITDVHDRMAGYILSSNPLSAFDTDLFDVARFVKASGHEQAIKEFEDNKKRTHNIYGNYTFSHTYEKIDDEQKKVERKEQVEPWGAWNELPILKRLVFEPDELKDEVKAETDKEPSTKMTWLGLLGVEHELDKIREGKVGDDNDMVYFRIKDFRNYAQRVHTFITTELIKKDAGMSKLDFDEKQSILSVVGESIKISKRADSDAHDLLRTLFRDTSVLSKRWDNDDILDDWKFNLDKKRIPKNKVYQAGKAVNRIVAQETNIKDFLMLTTKTVSINKKYLSE